MSEDKPKKARRSFSKKLILINCFAAWLVLGASVPYGEATAIISHVLAFVTTMTAIYTGVGHLDYRKFLDSQNNQTEAENDQLV